MDEPSHRPGVEPDAGGATGGDDALDSKSIDEPTSGAIDRSTSDAVTERIDRSRKNYFRLRAGVSIARSRTQSIGPTASTSSVSEWKIELDPGLDFQLVYGRRIADGSPRVRDAVRMERRQRDLETVFRVDGGGNVVDQSSIQGRSSYLVHVLTVGLGYVIDVTDDIQINLNRASASSSTSLPRTPDREQLLPDAYSWYAQTSVAFRGQLGASISFAVSDSVSLGLFAGWSAVSGGKPREGRPHLRSIGAAGPRSSELRHRRALVIEF